MMYPYNKEGLTLNENYFKILYSNRNFKCINYKYLFNDIKINIYKIVCNIYSSIVLYILITL